MQRAFLFAAASLFAAPVFAEEETEISFDDVPPAVMETAIATAPGVDFYRVSIEVENGVSIYEFEAKDYAGRHVEIDVFEDGSLEEIEMETELSEVPDAVMNTLNSAAPGFEPSYIELSVRLGGRDFVYEFEGRLNGVAVDIEIREDGELLFISEDALS